MVLRRGTRRLRHLSAGSVALLVAIGLVEVVGARWVLDRAHQRANAFGVQWTEGSASLFRGVTLREIRFTRNAGRWTVSGEIDRAELSLRELMLGGTLRVHARHASVTVVRATGTEDPGGSSVRRGEAGRALRIDVYAWTIEGLAPGAVATGNGLRIEHGRDGWQVSSSRVESGRFQASGVELSGRFGAMETGSCLALEGAMRSWSVDGETETLSGGPLRFRPTVHDGYGVLGAGTRSWAVGLRAGRCRAVVVGAAGWSRPVARWLVGVGVQAPWQELAGCVAALPAESGRMLAGLEPVGDVELGVGLVVAVGGGPLFRRDAELRRLGGSGLRVRGVGCASGAAHPACVLLDNGGEVAWRLPADAEARLLRVPSRKERAAGAQGPVSTVQGRWVAWSKLPAYVRELLREGEDPAIGQHPGVELSRYERIVERSLREGRVVAGGSTVAMQLARNLFLGMDRTVARKLAEMVVALVWTARVAEEELLEVYANVVEWGDGVHGIAAAARLHLGVAPEALTVVQAAWLVSILPAPRTLGALGEAGRVRAEHRWRVEELLLRWMDGQAEWTAEQRALRELLRTAEALQVREGAADQPQTR